MYRTYVQLSRYCIYNKFCTLLGWKVARSYSLSFIKHEFFVKTLSINFWIIFISRRFLFSLRSLSSAASGVSPSTYFLLNIFINCFLYFLFFFFLFSIGSSIISWISGLSFFGVGDCSFSLKVFAFYIEFSYPRDKRSVNSTFSCTIFKISDLKTTFGAMLRMHS